MSLSNGDTIEVTDRIDVQGLENGFKYRMTDIKEFQGLQHYVFKCINTSEWVKVPIQDLDYHIEDGNEALKV